MLDASKKVLLREGKPLALTPNFSRRGRSDGMSPKALTGKSFVIRTLGVREVAGSNPVPTNFYSTNSAITIVDESVLLTGHLCEISRKRSRCSSVRSPLKLTARSIR